MFPGCHWEEEEEEEEKKTKKTVRHLGLAVAWTWYVSVQEYLQLMQLVGSLIWSIDDQEEPLSTHKWHQR